MESIFLLLNSVDENNQEPYQKYLLKSNQICLHIVAQIGKGKEDTKE